MHFLETRTSSVMADMGLDPRLSYSLDVRLRAQNAILDALVAQYQAADRDHKMWITDRTPIDTAVYMLTDVQRDCLMRQSDEVEAYVQRCIDVANNHFSVLVLVQPGIKAVDAEGKALAIPAYQEHFNHTAFGMLMDNRLRQQHYFIPRQFISLAERRLSLFNAAGNALESWRRTLAASELVMH